MADFLEDFSRPEERAVLKIACENSLKAYIKAMGFENVTSFKIISDNLNYVGYEKFDAEESWKKLNHVLWEITNG